MYCRNCGKELSDNAFVCPDCGEPTNGVKAAAKQPSGATPNSTSVTGFIFSLISIPAWLFFLLVTLLGYRYVLPMCIVCGTATFATVFTGLILSIKSMYLTVEENNSKARAFALSGIIISGIILLGFLLFCLLAGILL